MFPCLRTGDFDFQYLNSNFPSYYSKNNSFLNLSLVKIRQFIKVNIIVHFWLFVPFLVTAQNGSLKFKHLSLENGLSQSSITCILKDSRGFMWFGTEDGLNKYDGTNFTIYAHIPNDDESISSGYIHTIVEEEDGFLWIGTKNGLNYFDPINEKFTRYVHDPNNPKSLADNCVNALLKRKDGSLLIGTANGLNSFNRESGFSKYAPLTGNSQYNIVSIAEDAMGGIWVLSAEMLEKIHVNNGSFSEASFQKHLKNSSKYSMFLDSLNIWIGTNKGLLKYDVSKQTVSGSVFNGANESNGEKLKVLSITKGEKGKLWLGTHGGGLVNFDKTTGDFQASMYDPYNRLSLNSSSIRSIFLDETGILWVGTFGGGINKHDPNQFKFEHYKHHPGKENGLSESTVRSILLDKDQELWVGTHNGLNRMDRETGKVITYTYDQNDLSAISSDVVRALKEDSKGIIWAGTWENGLNSFNKRIGSFKRYTSLPGRTDAIGQVRALEVDAQDNVWIGGLGLWKFNPISNLTINDFYDQEDNSLNNYVINSLYFDTTSRLWIGTSNHGLNYLDADSNIVKQYVHNPADTTSITHNHVTSITEDKNGFIWVGTYGGGLNVLDIQKGTFQQYNTSNGLLNDVIYGVLADANGFIWFSSNAGLTRLDPDTNEFKYFGVDHGIQSEEFNAGAYFESKKGEFFFGGIDGLNSFFPNKIHSNKETSRIVFTNFQLLDEKTNSINTILDKHISRTEHIKLKYNQNTIALKFAELNYADNLDHSYEYQLEGYEKNWQDLGNKNEIQLGNLKQGDYTLYVRVRNDPRERASLQISMQPAPWRTKGAYTAYLVIIALIFGAVYRNSRKNREIRRQFELKIKNWEQETNGLKELQKNGETLTTFSLKKIEASSTDDKFLKRVTEVVEEHIEDSVFNVEKFAAEMFLSRSQLHRKLKALTGYSTTEFIRLIRLKRAAQLLAANSGTVSEIAYKVGFDNIGYFSKCFRETFGKPPSQYTLD